MGVTTEQVRQILVRMADAIEQNKQYLTDLDASIGDGDHGHNMARGFMLAKEKLLAGEGEDIGALIKLVAMALIANVGGASGPLYGTLFLKISTEVKGMQQMGLAQFTEALQQGIEGVEQRGRAQPGEKTMLDALVPFQAQLARSAVQGEPACEALPKAAAATREGADETKDMIATKGRASYMGAQSKGHIDPGAMSISLMMDAIAACWPWQAGAE